MKKQIIFIFGLFLLAFVACKKDALTLTENNVKEQHVGNGGFRTFVNPFDSAGYWHNYECDNYYASVFVENEFNPEFIQYFYEYNGLDTMEDNGFPIVDIVEGTLDMEQFLINESAFSSRAIDYVMATLDATEDLEYLLSDIASLEVTVDEDNLLTQSEKDIIFIGLAVAKYSFVYWQTNLDNWAGEEIFADAGGDIVGADIGGAVAGAVLTGLTGGADYGSAIVAGAVGASTGAAVSWVWSEVKSNMGW